MPAPINQAAYYGQSYSQPQTPQTTWYQPNYAVYPPQQPVYNNPMPQPQRPQNRQVIEMIPVDGIEQVNNYPVVDTTYFFDKTKPVFYIKDATGLRIFDYTERNQNGSKNEEYVTKAEFEEFKKTIDELMK